MTLAVTELPLHGRKYTWSSSSTSASPTLVRLDRVFCSLEWEEMFPDCLLQSCASGDSDHCPLLLGLQDSPASKRRFHFEAFWPSLDGFMETVEAAWTAVPGTSPSVPTGNTVAEVQGNSKELAKLEPKDGGPSQFPTPPSKGNSAPAGYCSG